MMNRRNILTAGVVSLPLAAALPGPALSASKFGLKPNLPRDQSAKLQKAIDAVSKTGGHLHLPAGIYVARKLKISRNVTISGVAGMTRLVLGRPSGYLLHIEQAKNVTLSGLWLDGGGQSLTGGDNAALLSARQTSGLMIEHCHITNSRQNGIGLEACAGKVIGCTIEKCRSGGIFSLDSKGLEIGHNHVSDIGDNAIMVWQSSKREDGSLVHHNRIKKVLGLSGGNGQNGNGVGIYRAGNVIVSDNRITDCNFSAVRNNGGENVVITNNSCSRLDEVAIFVEFGFQGAVVSGNLIDHAGMGISITNFNEGGRLAVCANNVVRDMLGARSNPDTQAIGIAVEADSTVTGNVVENAKRAGIWMGWGKYMRDVSATGNIVRGCDIGVCFSGIAGATSALISNNLITSAKHGVVGMDHDKIITGDLSLPAAKPPKGILVNANLVS